MLIKYLGPSPVINVGVKGKVLVHVKDKALDYPDEVAEELLQDKKNNFEAVGNQKSEVSGNTPVIPEQAGINSDQKAIEKKKAKRSSVNSK